MAKKPSFSVRKPSAAAEAFVRGDLHVASEPTPIRSDTPKPKAKRKKNMNDQAAGRGVVLRSDGRTLRRMTVYLPIDLGKRLAVHAAENETDISTIATQAINDFLS